MARAKTIRTNELVRRIRDRIGRQLAGKSDAEVLAYYRQAGTRARKRSALAQRRRRRA